jgi:hypothetical protein
MYFAYVLLLLPDYVLCMHSFTQILLFFPPAHWHMVLALPLIMGKLTVATTHTTNYACSFIFSLPIGTRHSIPLVKIITLFW